MLVRTMVLTELVGMRAHSKKRGENNTHCVTQRAKVLVSTKEINRIAVCFPRRYYFNKHQCSWTIGRKKENRLCELTVPFTLPQEIIFFVSFGILLEFMLFFSSFSYLFLSLFFLSTHFILFDGQINFFPIRRSHVCLSSLYISINVDIFVFSSRYSVKSLTFYENDRVYRASYL